MSENRPSYQQALNQANQAYKQGDLTQARKWAGYAARLDPTKEVPWLMLGVLANPRASIEYFKKALEINPKSEVAREGIHRATKKLRQEKEATQPRNKNINFRFKEAAGPENMVRKIPPLVSWLTGLAVVFIFGLLVWGSIPSIRSVAASVNILPSPTYPLRLAARINQLTPTPTATFTPTPTQTPTPTFTPTPSATSIPTNTPTPRPTKTVSASDYADSPSNYNPRPSQIGEDEFWIEVNLTAQQLIAHRGNKILKTFIVSTGTWAHPTVVGEYQIYVKYEATTMSGPGYYLPDVPYTMYFYEGYGIHGTYWHSNFGTPMSHGCVNMETSEAAWVFGYAEVGTWVIIHY